MQGLWGEHLEAVFHKGFASRGIPQRAKDHNLEVDRHAPHGTDHQGRFAHATHAQHAHHPATLPHDPLNNSGQFSLTPVETWHIEGLAPLYPWSSSRCSVADHLGRGSSYALLGKRLRVQQSEEPGLIEQHFLVRCFPEGTDLLFLAPGSKGLLL